MKISDKYNCAFIHIPKTAGTSITSLLLSLDPAPPKNLNCVIPAGANLPIQLVGRHALASVGQMRVGAERWAQLHKFAVVRHPADRLLSMYTYAQGILTIAKHPPLPSVKDWLRATDLRYRPQSLYLDTPIDTILHFEALDADFAALSAVLGLGAPTLPHLNTSTHAPWQSVFDASDLAVIEQRYAADYTRFGYPKST